MAVFRPEAPFSEDWIFVVCLQKIRLSFTALRYLWRRYENCTSTCGPAYTVAGWSNLLNHPEIRL